MVSDEFGQRVVIRYNVRDSAKRESLGAYAFSKDRSLLDERHKGHLLPFIGQSDGFRRGERVVESLVVMLLYCDEEQQ